MSLSEPKHAAKPGFDVKGMAELRQPGAARVAGSSREDTATALLPVPAYTGASAHVTICVSALDHQID